MGTDFRSSIRTNKYPVIGLTPERQPTVSAPTSPANGQIYFDITLNKLRQQITSAWVNFVMDDDSRLTDARTPLTHTHAQGDITGLAAALAALVPTSRLISTGTGLSGGGDLSADRTLSVIYGSTAGTAAQGNDTRLSDARTPTAHNHPQSEITNLTTDLAALAAAATETAIGRVELATVAEVLTGTDTARAVTPAGVQAKIAALVNSAPGLLDTLDEIANALGDDPNFATTITTALAGKAPMVHGHDLTDANITGTLAIAKGGTGGTTAATARAALGTSGSFYGTSPALTADTWSASIAHGLGVGYPTVALWDLASGEMVELDVKYIDTNNIQIRSGAAASAGVYGVRVVG